jgi:membrane protein
MSSRIPPPVRRARTVLGAVVTEVRAEKITFMAGSIAYHAFLSLLPFLLLVLFVVSQLGDDRLAAALVRGMAGYLTPETVDVLVVAAQNAADGRLSLVGLAVLVWGTLRIFRGLDTAFSDIYESEAENTFLDQVRDGLVVFAALAGALFLVTVADTVLRVPSLGVADAVVGPVGSALALAVAFLPMYYVFPDEDVTVREVIPGALVAGVGWTLLRLGFGFYVASTSATEYGIVGAVILLITWLYFGGLLLLVGASVNAVLAGRSEDVAAIAWGAEPGTGPERDDAPFVADVETLRTVLEGRGDSPVRVAVGNREVILPSPTAAEVDIDAVDRPAALGGSRETAAVVLRWESR